MGRPKEPVDLIKAKGKTHLSTSEYETRKDEEVNVPFVDIHPPEYLTGEKQIEKFHYYADMLLAIGIFTELDVDCLARYIMAEQLYLQYTNLIIKLIKKNDVEKLGKAQTLQDKAFKQCRDCARDLGLTISSRCKLVVPQVDDGDDDDEL